MCSLSLGSFLCKAHHVSFLYFIKAQRLLHTNKCRAFTVSIMYYSLTLMSKHNGVSTEKNESDHVGASVSCKACFSFHSPLGVCDIYCLRYYCNCCFNDVQFYNIEYFAKTKQNGYRVHAYISLTLHGD